MNADIIHMSDIRVIKSEANTRLIFTLSEPTKLHVFMLTHPTRIVADFENAHLAKRLNELGFPTPEVQSMRSGYPKPATLRLVLETPDSVHFTAMPKEKSSRFVLDVFSPRGKPTVTPKNELPARKALLPQVNEKAFIAKPSLPLPQASSSSAINITTHTNSHHVITVVIDAGHGGKDPGALGIHGTHEKDVVLAIAKRLASLINQQPNMHAVLTRSGDYFVPLRDRLRLARKGKADLFMSIHADSYFNTQASGMSVYTLSRRGATSEAARWLAKRENYLELGGVDLGELGDQSYLLRSVLIDLAQTATSRDSMRFGVSMLDSLDTIAPLHYTRVEQAPFMVLKSPDIPSVLVETGFISNGNEELRLRDVKYQARIAQALFEGVRSYLKKNPQTG